MNTKQSCPICGGSFEVGTTTFTVDYGKGVFIARHVPAEVCGQCGESWIDDVTSQQLESLLLKAKKSSVAIEVVDLAA